jgi:hypothetical protein
MRMTNRRDRFRRVSLGVLLALGALAVVSAQPAPRTAPASPFRIESLASPAGADSAEPQLTVEGERAILSWLETHGEHTTLKFAERISSGWSAPREVVSGHDLVANAADVPSVRALADGTLAAAWPQENGANPEAYDVRVSLSKDGGRTWSRPASPHHDGTKTQHGFASLFPAPGGGFGLLWLDGRETKPDAPEDQAGNMTLRATEYGQDGAQRADTLVKGRVCDCCPLSTAITSEGPIVAFRDRSPGEIRDIYVSRLVAGRWSAATPVHRDGWKITGCPVNGPAVSARRADVAVAWFTGQTGSGRAFVAFSSDAGRTFGAPIRVDDGVAIGRVQIALLQDGSAAVSWIESKDSQSLFKIRRIDRSGARSSALTVGEGMGTAQPRLAPGRDELLLAWVEYTRGSTRVRTARTSLPR